MNSLSVLLAITFGATLISAGDIGSSTRNFSGLRVGFIGGGYGGRGHVPISAVPITAPALQQIGVAKLQRVNYVQQPVVNVNYVQQPLISYVTRPVKSVSYVARPVVSYSAHPILAPANPALTSTAAASVAAATPAAIGSSLGIIGGSSGIGHAEPLELAGSIGSPITPAVFGAHAKIAAPGIFAESIGSIAGAGPIAGPVIIGPTKTSYGGWKKSWNFIGCTTYVYLLTFCYVKCILNKNWDSITSKSSS